LDNWRVFFRRKVYASCVILVAQQTAAQLCGIRA
jgi:hypothetical protein